jgi:hypothetical protein
LPYKTQLIGVGEDYKNFRENINRPIWQAAFLTHKLGYLNLNDLCDILDLNREVGTLISPSIIYKKLINERLLPVSSYIQ